MGGPSLQSISVLTFRIVHSAVRADTFTDFETFRLALTNLPCYVAATAPQQPPPGSTQPLADALQKEFEEVRKLRAAMSESVARMRKEFNARLLTLEGQVHVLQKKKKKEKK